MAKSSKKANEPISQSPLRADNAPIPPEQSNSDDSLIQAELAEMRNLTESLIAAVQDVQVKNARTEIVRGAMEDVRADVRAASRAMIIGQPTAAHPTENGQTKRGCGPCGCVDDGCCAFDIKVWQVRAAKPQIEPADMGDIGPFINAMEVQIYFTVDDVGFVWPGLATTMDLRADGLPGGPGPWVVINRVVQRVTIPRGTSVAKQLRVEVREHDEGLERPIGMKDEIGENVSTITLDCCTERVYPPMPLDIYLQHGGEGRGMVQVAFYAERVCC